MVSPVAGLSWVACEALTGRVIERLPALECRQIAVTIGRYESAVGAALPLSSAPAEWERAVLEGATFLVLRDGPTNPIWGGWVLASPRTDADRVELTLPTAEAYLDARYVGDEDYGNEGAGLVGQNLIVKDLVEKYVAAGPNGGIPIRVEVLGGDGTPRERHYRDAANETVYSRLQELSKLPGGPEWTIGWEHSVVDGVVRYTPVLYVGDRIGSSPMPGMGPGAVFRLPGAVSSTRQERDYSRGKGANHVRAWSAGQGDEHPAASYTVPDLDRPTVEYRFSPSTSIVDEATLAAHAERKGLSMAQGRRSFTVTANYDSARTPRLGVDWGVGDDIGLVLAAPAWPRGVRSVHRALGWRMTLDGVPTVAPVLAGEISSEVE